MIVLFDGLCNLCSASVRFIVARDPAARFRFASLQSPAAQALLAPFGAPATALESVVLLDEGRLYTRSDAALRIARALRPPWPLCTALLAVPRPLRDALYEFVARHRFRWFGRRSACFVPTPELQARFLEASSPSEG
jgi:predicted DCC family thiol-disulfide oxidoreductase YuxK